MAAVLPPTIVLWVVLQYEIIIVDMWKQHTPPPFNKLPESYSFLVKHSFLWRCGGLMMCWGADVSLTGVMKAAAAATHSHTGPQPTRTDRSRRLIQHGFESRRRSRRRARAPAGRPWVGAQALVTHHVILRTHKARSAWTPRRFSYEVMQPRAFHLPYFAAVHSFIGRCGGGPRSSTVWRWYSCQTCSHAVMRTGQSLHDV